MDWTLLSFLNKVRFDSKNTSITVAKKGNIIAVHKGNYIKEGALYI